MSTHAKHARRSPLLDRSGREPVSARSPEKMRLALAVFGAIVFAAIAAYALIPGDQSTPLLVIGIGTAVLAVVALVDAVVLVRRRRASAPPRDR